jgi:hypothetical protein
VKKIFAFALLLLCLAQVAAFAEYVNGYTRRDGTSVNGYNRSNADSTVQNNYSYVGNTNPYTGATGTNYYRHSRSSAYYDGN